MVYFISINYKWLLSVDQTLVKAILVKHLVIGQRIKFPNFSAFHWSPYGSMVSINQHIVTARVVYLPKMTETSLFTEADLITESDQAVRAVHSCNSWF